MSKQVADERRFHFGAMRRDREGPTVVSGGWERVGPDYKIRRSGFKYFGLELVVSGQGTLRMMGHEFPLHRGVVFAYGPGIPHEIDTDPKDRLSKYFVDFAGTKAEGALRNAGIAPGVCQVVAAAEEVQAAFEQVLSAGRRGTTAAAEIAALQGRILLLLISEVRLPSGTRGHRARQTFLRCRDYLEKNCVTIRTAEAAATACGVAPAYFSRLFRRFAGQPAYRYLMRLKMTQAAAILERQQLNVSETAESFGMDPFHFSRAFRRVHGRPPIAFLQA
jgi:AraC-like DNA-binding protein